MIKNFNDLILFIYFSKQQINLKDSSLFTDPLTIIVPLLKEAPPSHIQEKFSEGVHDYILMRLTSLIKFELLKSLISKGCNLNGNDQISNLIKEARKITYVANSQSGELARIYKKIEKAAVKGDSWLNWNTILPENVTILKEQGYEVIDSLEGFSIEW